MTDHIRIPLSGNGPVSSGVIQALATLTNTPPIEMPPLYESLDPSVLDAVFDQGSGEWDAYVIGHGGAFVYLVPSLVSAQISPSLKRTRCNEYVGTCFLDL